MHPLPLFPTTVIGSMPRPQYVKDLLLATLRDLPPELKIGLGCVDVRFPEIETPETIAARVEQALAYVSAERLTLNPDCGFAPGKDHEIPLEEAYAKLRNLAGAAKVLRERQGA